MGRKAHNNDFSNNFRIILIGDAKVGKSCVVKRLIDSTDNDIIKKKYFPTLGVDIKKKSINIDGKNIPLALWDIAGLERRADYPSYYMKSENTKAIAIFFDLTNKQSFQNCDQHIRKAKQYASKNTFFILVGTKSDLKNQRQVSKEIASVYAHEHDMSYVETSAQENVNITQLFRHLTKEVLAIQRNDSRQKIQQSLTQYVERIEKHQSNNQINFAHGFWFMRASRARNRAANYYLALALLQKLANTKRTHSYFNENSIAQERDEQIRKNNIGSQLFKLHSSFSDKLFKLRSINSNELNHIIQSARKLKL